MTIFKFMGIFIFGFVTAFVKTAGGMQLNMVLVNCAQIKDWV